MKNRFVRGQDCNRMSWHYVAPPPHACMVSAKASRDQGSSVQSTREKSCSFNINFDVQDSGRDLSRIDRTGLRADSVRVAININGAFYYLHQE